MFGELLTISSASHPLMYMKTSSSMSAVRNAPVTFTMAPFLPSKASMVEIMSTDYIATVGDVTSNFVEPLELVPPISAPPSFACFIFFFLKEHKGFKRTCFFSPVSFAASCGMKVSFV
jgi:hypothetical protein